MSGQAHIWSNQNTLPVIEITEADFVAAAAAANLQYPAVYQITDVQNGLYVNTLSNSSYSELCNLSLNCPKTYETTTIDGNVWKGIWRASKTANVNDLFIWGGVVWRNKTGAIGTATDLVTLDTTNWEYIDRNNFSNSEYIPLSLICFYDFDQSWINYLQDEHTNTIGVDWNLNQIYGLTYNPALNSDWNCMSKSGIVFINNQLFFIANNLGNVISNKINGSIYNNDGNVYDNKFCSVISNNEQDVYENIAAVSDIDGAVNEVYNVNGGSFFFTHNFAASPVNAGSSVLYNLIPDGARVTKIITFGNATGGAGAQLAFGIETDAPALLPDALLAAVNAGQTYNNISTPATADRSLQIAASVANVTGGTVTVKVEFVIP